MTTPAQPAAGQRKGMRSSTWLIIGLGVALAAGAFLLWRSRQNTAASTTATTTGSSTTEDDLRGQISTLQTEIADLQSSASQDEGKEGGTTSTGGDDDSGGSTTKTSKPHMPSNVKGHATGPTAVALSWSKVTGATSYPWHVTYQGKVVKSGDASGNSATVSGLTANHTYTAHVAAKNSAGTSAFTNGPVVKTPRPGRGENEPGG